MLNEIFARKLRADQGEVRTNRAAMSADRMTLDAGNTGFIEKQPLAPDRIAVMVRGISIVVIHLERDHPVGEQHSTLCLGLSFVNLAKFSQGERGEHRHA